MSRDYTRLEQRDFSDDADKSSHVSEQKWRIWRLSNAIAAIFFFLSTYVQLNDPDPYIWVPVYLVPSLLCLAITVNPAVTGSVSWRTICYVQMGLCVIGLLYLMAVLVDLLGQEIVNPLTHEEGREFAGTGIILLWLSLCAFTSLGSNKPQRDIPRALSIITVIIGVFPLLLWGVCFIEESGQSVGHCKDMFPGMLGGAHKTEAASGGL